MPEWLVIWSVGQATWSVFRPILEDLAKDVAKDAAHSYVGQCFKSVFSVIYREPLTRATGLALKELLELIESELVRAEIDDAELHDWIDDVRQFTKQDDVRQSIASLFLQPDTHLDPKTFATAWQQLDGAHTLPADFSWQFVARRFTVKVAEIRQSSTELQETFASLDKAQDSTALKELAGLPPDFNLETYREALVERYGNLDFASLETTGAYYNDVRLWSVFVPQSVRECHEYDPQVLEVPKEDLQRLAEAGEFDRAQLAESAKLHDQRRQAYVNQSPHPVLGVADDSAIQRLVVLGDPGSGKSSLLRFLALRWARIDDANLRYTQPLPLLIELREYNRWECPSGKSFPKYLHEASTWHRLNQRTLKHLLEQPDRVVLLLDGLDEVFDPVERERVVNDIHRFSSAHKHVRIVVTSRVVGYQPHRLRSADFRHFMLQDLDAKQIGNFLDKWHDVTFDKPEEAEPKRQRLDGAIKNSQSIAQLAGNPLLLTMMAILNRNQKLPDDRVDLYQQCSRLLLHQWDVEGKLLDEFPGLNAEIGLREKTDILRAVAYAMQTRLSDNARANYIDGATLTTLIEDYLQTELRFTQARAVARALVEQLRTRNFILCALGADSYAFVHRTFLEYFCAADIVHQFNVAKTLSEQDLIALFDAHCGNDDWREVLRLICGQIDEQFVGRIVEHLAEGIQWDEWNGVSSIPELPLAILCLRETRNRSNLVAAGDALFFALRSCFSRFDRNLRSPNLEFLQTVVSATREFSGRWPHSQRPPLKPSWHGANLLLMIDWTQILATVFRDRSAIDKLAASDDSYEREGAYLALARHWPNDETRRLLEESAVQDVDESCLAAIRALGANWPDDRTRILLEGLAVERTNKHYDRRDACNAAIESLVASWPDDQTRKLLEELAVEEREQKSFIDGTPVYETAIRSLLANWPDDQMRRFMNEILENQKQGDILVARSLLRKWPDTQTRDLLDEYLSKLGSNFSDSNCSAEIFEELFDNQNRTFLHHFANRNANKLIRRAVLEWLVAKWPDETTRELLTQRAVQDDDPFPRSTALRGLAGEWPDENTRELLTQRAVQDDNPIPRSVALEVLARHWPDENTRELLAQRAVQDDNSDPRSTALQALAENWQDETTRELLTQRAVQDDHPTSRLAALKALAENWQDETTRELLAQRAVQDSDETTRGAAFTALGEMHSEFGRILPMTDPFGFEPLLDPLEPVPRGHIQKVAERLGIPPEDLDATVAALSDHLGWDITCGARPSG